MDHLPKEGKTRDATGWDDNMRIGGCADERGYERMDNPQEDGWIRSGVYTETGRLALAEKSSFCGGPPRTLGPSFGDHLVTMEIHMNSSCTQGFLYLWPETSNAKQPKQKQHPRGVTQSTQKKQPLPIFFFGGGGGYRKFRGNTIVPQALLDQIHGVGIVALPRPWRPWRTASQLNLPWPSSMWHLWLPGGQLTTQSRVNRGVVGK